MKVAVYVEGNTELIFVRELLYKWFDYNQSLVGFRCYNLRNSIPPGYQVRYKVGDINSSYFYEIVNVGTDVSVISKAIESAERYRNAGFDRIVALRDMFSAPYHDAVYKKCRPRQIIPEINEKFIQGACKRVNDRCCSDIIRVNFAIMEIEAWLLGMGWYFEREDACLSCDYLKSQFNLDMNDDPETTIYHPAKELGTIYSHIHKEYGKHEDSVEAIMGKLYKDDFIRLKESGKCQSFSSFMSNLINP